MNSDYNYDGGRKKDHRPLKTIILCILCIVVAGAVGLGVGMSIDGWRGLTITSAGNNPAPFSTPTVDEANKLGANTVLQTPGAELTACEVYDANVSACVGITTSVTTTNVFGQIAKGAISGSGFIISPDGYIVTNYHVIETADLNGYTISVMLYDGSEYEADIVGGDAGSDVALLKIKADRLPTVVIGNFPDTRVGETIYVIGNPLGELTYTLTGGLVSALERSIVIDENTAITMFQIDAAINSGNSGGPIFNNRGQVIGIASAKYSKGGVEGLGFAIPIDDAMLIINDLKQFGFIRGRPQFGIMIGDASYYTGRNIPGVYVVKVERGSCAETGDLRVGDIITAIDGTGLQVKNDLLDIKKNYKAGDTVTLTVTRDGNVVQVQLTLDEEGAVEYDTAENDRGYSSFGH